MILLILFIGLYMFIAGVYSQKLIHRNTDYRWNIDYIRKLENVEEKVIASLEHIVDTLHLRFFALIWPIILVSWLLYKLLNVFWGKK